MNPKTIVSFLCGCVIGGLLAAFWLRGSGAGTPSPQVTLSNGTATTAPVANRSPGASLSAPAERSPVTDAARSVHESRPSTADATAAPIAASAATYDFSRITNSRDRIEDIFKSERTDPAWSSQTVDSLNLILAGMPERSVIGEYGLTCKESLCKLEVHGATEQLASPRAEDNVQSALIGMFARPPGNEIFDDSMMLVEGGKAGETVITVFAHRRAVK